MHGVKKKNLLHITSSLQHFLTDHKADMKQNTVFFYGECFDFSFNLRKSVELSYVTILLF